MYSLIAAICCAVLQFTFLVEFFLVEMKETEISQRKTNAAVVQDDTIAASLPSPGLGTLKG